MMLAFAVAGDCPPLHGFSVPGASIAPQSAAKPASQNDTETSQKRVEQYLGRGYSDLKSDRYQEAVTEFRAALQLDPSLGLRARFPLAVALFELQKTADARREFLAVRTEAGNRPDVAYYLGRIDLMEGDTKGAIKELTAAAGRPPFPDTAFYLGSAYLKDGQLAPAEKWLQTAAQLTPDDAHVQERLSVTYQREGRRSDAETATAKAAKLNQEEAATGKLRIDCAQKLQTASLQEARQVCEQLFDPNDSTRLTMLGTLYGARGDYEDALRPLRRAAELDPKSPQTQYNLALVYVRLKRFEEARAALEPVAKLWPDLAPTSSLLGATLYELGDQPEAYRVLAHAHDLDPDDPATARMLFESAMILAERSLASQKYGQSANYLGEAIKLQPDDPEPHRLLAETYRASGRSEDADNEERRFQSLSANGRSPR